MVWLKYYSVENKKYAKEKAILVTEHEAELIIRKLARHFKIRNAWKRKYPITVVFTGRTNGTAWKISRHIRLPKEGNNLTLLLALHEFSHIYAFQKYKTSRHGKKLARAMKQIVNYARKMNYWGFGTQQNR